MPRSTAGASADNPKFFRTPEQLRQWLAKHHASVPELWVGLYKKASGRPSITWPELVDQLLCFGWIDGIRKSVDDISYANRVTPRRRGSNWSAVNLRRMAELIQANAVEPSGLLAYEARDVEKSERNALQRESVTLGPDLEATFRRNARAWRFFCAQPPSYRKLAALWVMSARREETRKRRFDTLIVDSEAGLRIAPLRR